MVMLSELRRFRLRDEQNVEAPLTDLSLDLSADEYPRVTRIVFRRSLTQLAELPWDAVTSIDWAARRILVTDLHSAHEIDEDALVRAVLVDRDILDALILDIPFRQSMRANDLWLYEEGGNLWLRAADVSPWAVLRRLGHGMLGRGANRRLVDWRDVEFLRGDPRAAREGHDYHRRVATLQPAEIARLLDALPYLHAAELLMLIADPVAADTLEVMRPERQVQVFEELEADQRVRLLQLMAPDNAADLLGRLGPQQAREMLNGLPAERRDALIELLRYPEDTAGGIMTNDIVVVPFDLNIGQAREAIRDSLARPDFVYYVYAVDTVESRRLQGVLTLRDLLLAGDRERVQDVMRSSVMALDPLMTASDAARRVADQHLAALPVVSNDGRLLGAVTSDAALMQILPESMVADEPRVFT